jgi:hypothetical protein
VVSREAVHRYGSTDDKKEEEEKNGTNLVRRKRKEVDRK